MTSTNPSKLSVRSPAELIAVVPYLLGFHPADSIVVVAFCGNKLVFAVRGDLPDPGAPAQSHAAAATALASVVARQDADGATVIGYGPPDRVTRSIDMIAAALAERGLPVLDTLRVTDNRYWSYTCDNPRCCPPEGTPFDPATSEIAAAATFAGQVALPDRAALARQVAPVDGSAREAMRQATDRAGGRLEALLDNAPAADLLGRRALRAAGQAAVRSAVARHRDGGRLTDDDVAWLSILLVHVPVRDYAWERITDEDWPVALWTDVLRRAEPDLAAAPASLLAFAAWRSGHGALASVSVERALDSVPGYSMALLMDEVLRNGIPPSEMEDWPPRERMRSAGRGGDAGRPRRRRARATRPSAVGPDHPSRSAPV